jgi:hypothetical protein
MFGSLPSDLYTRLSQHPAEGHQYDVTPIDNLVERSLRPGYSGLTPSQDYTNGRSAATIVKASIDDAITTLTKTYGSADMSTWRRAHAVSHLTSLTDTVGPTGETEPFEDRGSWVEFIAFTTGKPYVVPQTAAQKKKAAAAKRKAAKKKASSHKASQPSRTLAYTGMSVGLPLLALALVGMSIVVRRRRLHQQPPFAPDVS